MAMMVDKISSGKSKATKEAELRNYGASRQEESKNNAYSKPTFVPYTPVGDTNDWTPETAKEFLKSREKEKVNPVAEVPSVEQAEYDASGVYNALMDYLNAYNGKMDSLIERFRRKGKDDNLYNMNYALRQHKKAYGNGLSGQGLSNKFDIYANRAKADEEVNDRADEMLLNAKNSTYNNAFNLVNSAGTVGGMTPEQIRRLYANLV